MRTLTQLRCIVAVFVAAFCIIALFTIEAQAIRNNATTWRSDRNRKFESRKCKHLHGSAAINALDKNSTVAWKISKNHRLTIPAVKSTLKADSDLALDPNGESHRRWFQSCNGHWSDNQQQLEELALDPQGDRNRLCRHSCKGVPVLFLHFMICHSNRCMVGPASQAVLKTTR